MQTSEIYKTVLETIKPKDNSVTEKAKGTLKEIENKIKQNLIRASAMIGGSVAKGTYLKNDFDCDIFIAFDKSYKDKSLSNLTEKIIEDIFSNKKRIHGSRDYFQAEKEGINYEIIPVYNIKDKKDAKNITDFSPKHVEWFRRKANDQIRDEIRITKLFLKAQKVYGAESYINGISGHVVDILIINYKTFERFIKDVASWQGVTSENPKIIDIEKHYKNKNPLFFINKSKISPLVVIDPVDINRNAAAALSQKKLDILILSAKEFIKNPSKDFFKIHHITKQELIKSKSKNPRIIFTVSPKGNNIDVAGTKVYKLSKKISKYLKENDFKIIKEEFDWDKKNDIIFYFELEKIKLEKIKKQKGPKKEMTKACEEFRKKHEKKGEKTFYENNTCYANTKRRFTDIKEALISYFKENKDKIKKITDRYEFFEA